MNTRNMAWSLLRPGIAAGVWLAAMTAAVPVSAQTTPASKAPATPAAPAPATKAPAAPATPAVPATASKDTPAAAKPATEATRLYDEGVKLDKAGQLDKARESLLASFKLEPSPKTAAQLGRVELKAGKHADAAEHLAFALQREPAVTGDERKANEKMLDEAKAKVGTVTVHVDVAGADVLADGRVVGKSPLSAPVFVEPGLRQFEAKKEGYRSEAQSIALAAGSAREVKLALSLPSVLPTRTAAHGPAPSTSPEANAASSRCSVFRGRHTVWPRCLPTRRVTPIGRFFSRAGIGVSGALAIAGIGSAIGAGVKDAASQKELDQMGGRDKCNAIRACTDRYNDLQRQWARLATASVYTFVGAAVVGGATAAYALFGDKLFPPARVSAVVTPKGGAFGLTTSW